MIDYAPFWNTLDKSSENWYTLTNNHHISSSTLYRLKHNRDISTKTINDLCRILDCEEICPIGCRPAPVGNEGNMPFAGIGDTCLGKFRVRLDGTERK